MSLKRSREAEDFIVAAVVVLRDGLPDRTYLIPSTVWGVGRPRYLGRNERGGKTGPYLEVRTTGRRHAAALAAYEAKAVLGTL